MNNTSFYKSLGIIIIGIIVGTSVGYAMGTNDGYDLGFAEGTNQQKSIDNRLIIVLKRQNATMQNSAVEPLGFLAPKAH